MFTGIIKKTGKIRSVKRAGGGLIMKISNPFKGVKMGESISVNGVCSTVVKAGKTMTFEYMPETLRRTDLVFLREGEEINLEQSLRMKDRLDGHMVLGHIDCRGEIVRLEKEGNSSVLDIRPYDQKGIKHMVFKGSVAVEGVSLTVARISKKAFAVKLIPHTLKKTNLKHKKKGDIVNIEFDILAKYVLNKRI